MTHQEKILSNKLFRSIAKRSYQELADSKSALVSSLSDIGIKPNDGKTFLQYILKIAAITDNPKTRVSFFRSYLRVHSNKIDKDGRGGSVVIEITRRCDKKCRGCYAKPNSNRDMDTHVLNAIIDHARKNYKHVFLTGGDPILDARVFTISKANPDIMFFMFTSASVLDEDFSKKLSKIGNLIPLLSVDGNSQALHDSVLKGRGSFKQVIESIKHLNGAKISWGFISVVTALNAKVVLSSGFIQNMKKKGAILARYLEFMPVGPKAIINLLPSADDYYLMEKRKREIIDNDEIYMQDTSQTKCTGLLFFDVDGNIKNCPFFHYAKHNISEGNLKDVIKTTRKDWYSAQYEGECPLYSNPRSFRDHLRELGWNPTVPYDEEYLESAKIANRISNNYKEFLRMKECS